MRFPPLVALCLPVFLTGCALTSTESPTPETGLSIHGSAFGGQQPIVGAHVYLFAANTTGYGNASVSLLKTAAPALSDAIGGYILTGADGSFDISTDYTCTASTQVYLYSLGGNPGAGANSAAALLAVLGNCPTAGTFATTIPFVFVNEVSTVAAAYSMAGFATDATHVSSSGTALAQVGIANAFLNSTNLAALATGTALTVTPAGNGAVPQTTINTLANILAACINSIGPTSAGCSSLFTNARNGTTAPTDTASAAINIAHNPGANIAALYSIPAAAPPFLPSLAAQPNDFTLGLNFNGAGLSINSPSSLAIDGSGSVWIANTGTTVVKLSSLGTAAPGSPFTTPYKGTGSSTTIALDTANNVWVGYSVDHAGQSVYKLSPAGVYLNLSAGNSGKGGTKSLAVDGNDNVSYTGTSNGGAGFINRISSSAVTTAGFPLTSTLANDIGIFGTSIGISTGANGSNSALTLYASTGGAPVAQFTAGGVLNPSSAVVDSALNVWTSNSNSSVSRFNPQANGTVSPSGGYIGGGLNTSTGIAVDGLSNVWISNGNGSVSKLLNSSGAALSPATGYTGGSQLSPRGIAVDGSGNIWLPNANNSVTELIGAGTPVITPLSQTVKLNTPGTRP